MLILSRAEMAIGDGKKRRACVPGVS